MDKYQKVRVLGKGSFGSAILIKRKVDDVLFVVKEVSLLKMSKKERDGARHECTILQKLKHPNIVRYVEQFENQKSLYIVMEYCDGGDLSAKINQTRRPMKESLVMYYFSQVCLAMEYLHSFHMLHRDIKTMNVFLMKNGAVKLGDFGITTVLRNTMGMANTVCGTPYYFSPELCRNKPYNNKSDIWALGVLLYECATGGRHPFDGGNMNQLMQRIITGQCPEISSQYSPEFRKMIAWCLQKDPIKRPSIKQLLSLRLVRRSLEQLEENLMLATQCRVRLKDIIDFEVGSPNSENSNECQGGKKTPCPTPRADQKKMKQTPGLTPGQAAAMAVVQQSPRKVSPESRPVADILGPKPRAANANINPNNANCATPSDLYQRNILDNLQHMRDRLSAVALAGASPYARRPSSPSNHKVMSPNSESADKSDESVLARDSPPFCGYQPDVKRIKSIMAKYEHGANPQAKETIHAYMRRKQEDYLRKQKEDLERRKRLNELREKELQRILVQQRRVELDVENNVHANGYNGNKKPVKDPQPSAPLPREAGVSPRNNRDVSSPLSCPLSRPHSRNEHRCAPAQKSPAQAGGLPYRTPAQGLQRKFGVDPRYSPYRPVKGVSKGNAPPLMAQRPKAKIAANSPLHADKAARQNAKPSAVKLKEGPPLGEQQKILPKNRYSNGYALNRLDHRAREVVSRDAEERKCPVQRPSFALNAEALDKNRNSEDKAAAQQGMVDDGMFIAGTRVPQLRTPPTRQIRPLRPALLNALLNNKKDAEYVPPKVSPLSTPTNKPVAEKHVRSSLNLEAQPHLVSPSARLQKRIPSSPALTPRGLAVLTPVARHSADDAAEGGADRLLKRVVSGGQNPDSCDVQARCLPLTPSKPNPSVTSDQPFDQLVSDSSAAIAKPVENDNRNSQDCITSALHPVQINSSPLKVSSLEVNGIEESISEAELIDVAHTVKGRTPAQSTSSTNVKGKNLSMSDTKSSDSTIQRRKAILKDVKPVFHPSPNVRFHHIRWPLSDEAARYAGMVTGPDIPTAMVELHPLTNVGEEDKKQEVSMPSMIETLHTLRSEASPLRNCTSADHVQKQLVLLKKRQRFGVERHRLLSENNDKVETNLQSSEPDLEPTSEKPTSRHDTPRKKAVLSSDDISSGRCTNAESDNSVSYRLGRDSETDTRRTSLVEGYEEMLQHLRNLLEKRRVSYRNIRKFYKKTDDSVSRPLSPSNLSEERLDNCVSRNEMSRPTLGPVSNSPPRLLKTKPGNDAQARRPLLACVDELSESVSSIDEEVNDLNEDDDNFEDAVPLSPVHYAVGNDMYTQMLQQNVIKATEVNP